MLTVGGGGGGWDGMVRDLMLFRSGRVRGALLWELALNAMHCSSVKFHFWPALALSIVW